jgi:uncharacterized protein (DUF362 family)
VNRREFIPLAAAGALAGFAGFAGGRKAAPQQDSESYVAIQKAGSYDEDLAEVLKRGFVATCIEVEGKSVLLKPHMAGLTRDEFTNTHASVLAAAFAVLKELGAAQVRIGDASPFHRDSWALAAAAGYRDRIPNFDDVFLDLHGDDVAPVAGFNGSELFLPAEAMRAEMVISVGKLKTDTRYGAALSVTNLLGLIPGSVYGWPEGNTHKLGSPRTATELARFFRRSYAIVDGIVGMEGDGPVKGSAKQAGMVVMGTDLVAVDATCCRLMGIDPGKVEYLSLAADRQGVAAESRIKLVGDSQTIEPVPFRAAKPLA